MEDNGYTIIIIPPDGKDSDDIQFEIVIDESYNSSISVSDYVTVNEQEQMQFSGAALVLFVYLMVVWWYHCSD